MGRKTDRAPLVLTPKEKESLTRLSQSRTASKREIERACILLKYAEGMSFSEIHREIRLSRPSIYKCIDKALAAGVSVGLKDKYHRPKSPEITEEAKSWVVSLACCKPKDHGFAAELWTLSALTAFVHERAESAGFPRLARVPKMTIWRILDTANIKPHRIRYYLEKKDPDFDRKMREVLMVYQEVNLQNDRKNYRTSRFLRRSARSLLSAWTRNRESRQSRTRPPICLPSPDATPKSGATTNISVMGRFRFLRPWIFIRVK